MRLILAGAILCVNTLTARGGEDCRTREIAERTVRLEVDAGSCTGVLVDSRTIRTAGHCFTLGGSLVRVTDASGEELAGEFTVSYIGPRRNGDPSPHDEAEVRADRDLARVKPLPIVGARRAAPGVEVTVASLLPGQILSTHAGTFSRGWRVRYLVLGYRSYEISSADGWTVKPGQSGSPVLLTEGCELKLLGTVTSYSLRAQVTFFDPVDDIATLR